MFTLKVTSKPRLLIRVIPYVGMFLLALLLWLPFGFKTTGLVEELGINELLDKGDQLFFVTPNSPLSFVRTRPLQMFTFALAYTLDHDSYRFYNIFMMLFLFGKMVVVYGLVLQFLPGKKVLAFVTGVLFALYPSDTGLFALRTIHIHCATLAYLIAVYLLIQFSKQHGRRSWLALIGAILLLVFSLEQYQIGLVAAVLTPLLLLYFMPPNRHFWVGTGLWYAAMATVVLYALWANQQSTIQSYEGSLLPSGLLTLDNFRIMLSALLVGYQRQFSSWAASYSKLNNFPFYGVYIVLGLIISAGISGCLIWQERSENDNQPVSWRRYGLLIVGAIVWFAIGIAIYLPIPTHRFQDFRIYLLSILGSALVLSLTLYLVSRLMKRYQEIVFVILALPFIGLALLNAFVQQQYYVNFSLQQQSLIQAVVTQAPQIKPDTFVLVIDPNNVLNREYVLYHGVYWQTVLRYVYSDPSLQALYCGDDEDAALISETCKLEADGVHLTLDDTNALNPLIPSMTVPYDRLLLFTSEADGQLKLLSSEEAAKTFKISGYNPQAHIMGQTPPYRSTTMFSCDPALACYRASVPVTNFDLPIMNEIGTGWRAYEADGTGGTFRWSIDRTSTVDVNLADTSDLVVEFKVLMWLDPKSLDSLKLSVNNQDIPLKLSLIETGGRLYQATIPRSVLVGKPSLTQLVFTIDQLAPVPDAPDIKLGFALNWLRIRPAS